MREARPRSPDDREGEDDPQGADRPPRPRHRDRSELDAWRHVGPRDWSGTDGGRRRAGDLDAGVGSDQESGVPQIEGGLLRGTAGGPDRAGGRPGGGVMDRLADGEGTTGIGLLARRPLPRPGLGCVRLSRTARTAVRGGVAADLFSEGRGDPMGRYRLDGIGGRASRGRGLAAAAGGGTGPGALAPSSCRRSPRPPPTTPRGTPPGRSRGSGGEGGQRSWSSPRR